MAQMGDESEDETPGNEQDDGMGFLLSDDGKDIDLRCDARPITKHPVCLCTDVCPIHSTFDSVVGARLIS